VSAFLRNAAGLAAFNAAKMGKADLVCGEQLFAGLNAFEPGQQHEPHAHAGQDKLYLILEGAAIVTVGEETATLASGDVAFAPAGVVHAVRNPGPARLVVMAVLAPPPRK
jgi:quercetin dioxygenase-like cupin family protein